MDTIGVDVLGNPEAFFLPDGSHPAYVPQTGIAYKTDRYPEFGYIVP